MVYEIPAITAATTLIPETTLRLKLAALFTVERTARGRLE